MIAARNELLRKMQFELTVLESLVRFLNRNDKYDSECRISRSNKQNFQKNKPFSVARKSLYNFTGSAKLCNLAENKNPIAIKGQLSQKHVHS